MKDALVVSEVFCLPSEYRKDVPPPSKLTLLTKWLFFPFHLFFVVVMNDFSNFKIFFVYLGSKSMTLLKGPNGKNLYFHVFYNMLAFESSCFDILLAATIFHCHLSCRTISPWQLLHINAVIGNIPMLPGNRPDWNGNMEVNPEKQLVFAFELFFYCKSQL